jgi:hypothetical protein
MSKIFSLLLATVLFAGCGSDSKTKTEKKEDVSGDSALVIKNTGSNGSVNPLHLLLGSFVGDFGDNKITLLIVKAEGDSVLGRSVVGGNDRPFAGTFTSENGRYHIVAKEPGDDPNDGVFDFTLSTDSPDKVAGNWKPNDTKKKAKDYSLERRVFEYKADVGSFPEASQRLLVPKDIENMVKEDLEYMRNEIFARHGFCFKKKDLRQEFEMLDWYVPDNVEIKDRLTDIEKKNIALIRRYEKYALEYSDEYGR